MPGAFHSIGTLSSALSAFQRAIDVTGSNIANANTAGYSRRKVNISSLNDVTFWQNGPRSVGSGVSIASINRVRDSFVDRNASRSQSLYGEAQARAQHLASLEGIFGEPSSEGISAALGKVFDSFSALGASPNSSAARAEARSAAITLTERIRDASSRISQERSHATEAATADFNKVTELTAKIAELNTEIAKFSVDGSPNELMDQRNLALDELSGLIKIETFQHANNSITVSALGVVLVDQGASQGLPDGLNPALGTVDPALAGALRGGSLAGHLQGIQAADNQSSWLNDFASSLTTEFNAIHSTGVNSQGATGINLFNPNLTSAGDMAVSTEVMASAQAIVAGVTNQPGDGGLAQAMGNLRQSSLGALNGRTFESYFKDAMSALGAEVSQAQNKADTELAVMSQIENQRASLSGVNLDEEFSDMIRLQRSYQAAARALSIADQMTEDLLGIVR